MGTYLSGRAIVMKKLSKHFKMKRVNVLLPEQKVQKRYTGTTTANIIGAI